VSSLCDGDDDAEFLVGAAGLFAISSLATGTYLLYNRYGEEEEEEEEEVDLTETSNEDDPDAAALKTKYVDGESRLARWSRNWKAGRYSQPGKSFHQADVNYFLKQYEDRLIDPQAEPEQNILVPLCGKSVDMVFLATRGHHVFGVEAVQRPVNEFEEDNDLQLSRGETRGLFTIRSLLHPIKRFIPSSMWVGAVCSVCLSVPPSLTHTLTHTHTHTANWICIWTLQRKRPRTVRIHDRSTRTSFQNTTRCSTW